MNDLLSTCKKKKKYFERHPFFFFFHFSWFLPSFFHHPFSFRYPFFFSCNIPFRYLDMETGGLYSLRNKSLTGIKRNKISRACDECRKRKVFKNRRILKKHTSQHTQFFFFFCLPQGEMRWSSTVWTLSKVKC